MPELHIDAAIDFIVDHISHIELPDDPQRRENARQYESDLVVAHLAERYWQQRGISVGDLDPLREGRYSPFYDAAWELARMGILRPGGACPRMQGSGPGFQGDTFSVTDFGWEWVRARTQEDRPPRDPSRFVEEIAPYARHFGPAFMQRAQEAAGCHRAANYLACCAMCGAAAESVLLAAAIAKIGDEERVVGTYMAAQGRRKTVNTVVGDVGAGLRSRITTCLMLLDYWRDAAAHGLETPISVVEAEGSLLRLLSLAHTAHDNWDELTRSS